jgi:hypothetical protein
MYQERYDEHEECMQEAMRYLAEKYSEWLVDSMTDCEIGYSYGRCLIQDSRK